MTAPPFHVGAYVQGAPTSPRALVRHADLLIAYADGESGDDREAYLSHFVFGADMVAHFKANRESVAGFVGTCWTRWLTLDIDRADLAAALDDARNLVAFLRDRYPEVEDTLVYFSGGKGFHVLIELAHNPPPAVGFHRTARTYAETIAGAAGVTIDPSIYDIAHIIRLPNTRHPKSGLYKRRIDADALFALDIDGIRRHAAHPAGDGMPTVRTCPARLADDWREAERSTARAAEARAAHRQVRAGSPDSRAPKYLVDLLRFGVEEGERHQTLFKSAAWIAEQGGPPSLCHALLTEPGLDVGLTPADVARQIDCGIAHAQRQTKGGPRAEPIPAPIERDDERQRAIEHENDPLTPDATEFLFGANATGPYGAAGERR